MRRTREEGLLAAFVIVIGVVGAATTIGITVVCVVIVHVQTK